MYKILHIPTGWHAKISLLNFRSYPHTELFSSPEEAEDILKTMKYYFLDTEEEKLILYKVGHLAQVKLANRYEFEIVEVEDV